MKHTILSMLLLFSLSVRAQENLITLGGGYAFANVEDMDENLTGWRINLSYEFNAFEGQMSNGAVVGYMATKASVGSGLNQTDYELNTWPIYYMPKFLFGGDSFKGFLKGAVGLHISNYTKTTTLLIVEDNGVGFYGGLGAGAMLTINKLFITGEYEWAFASNSNYRNGFMNSAMLGIGIKF
jgi:hypothetical protein